jgi:hypothetical protein
VELLDTRAPKHHRDGSTANLVAVYETLFGSRALKKGKKSMAWEVKRQVARGNPPRLACLHLKDIKNDKGKTKKRQRKNKRCPPSPTPPPRAV